MILLRITVTVLPEKELEMRQTLRSMIESTEKEPGCLNYTVLSDIKDKNCFSLLEEWKSREDLDTHLASHRFGALLGTKALLSRPMEIRIHTVSRTEGMAAVSTVREKKSSIKNRYFAQLSLRKKIIS